jgi:hypothetical protein
MKTLIRRAGVTALLASCLLLGGCDDVRVYGSVGYSSFGHSGFGSSVTIGGRIR